MKEIRNTIKLLRFPFSLFLLPITLFSLYFIRPELDFKLILLLFIWHVLVFPSSNGYNSYHDKDEGPIGALAAPPKPTRLLLNVANVFDIMALNLSLFINVYFALFVLVYIACSRLYSNRKVRLKRRPVASFLGVFIFQGAWVFCANIFAFNATELFNNPSVIYSAIDCSFFIGTIYPLTQIYQHEADKKDGVKTLSMLLGRNMTFLFSATMFMLATMFIYFAFQTQNTLNNFWLFNVIMLPATIYFVYWMISSIRNSLNVNFKNTMKMVLISSFLNNLFFILILLK